MTNYREVLRLAEKGFSQVRIAESVGITRQTVSTIIRRAEELGLRFEGVSELSDRELSEKLMPQSAAARLAFVMPDYEMVHRELQKPGVTLMLMWQEYVLKCHTNGELPYQETQFRKYYHDWAAETKATMHITRKPGELMEVDWAGTTAKISDNITGNDINAYIFVAVLPYSGYGYVEAFWNMEQGSWIAGHVNAYEHFGGVARILVLDNLKTGVIKHTKSEIVLNRTYQEMAEHYDTAIIPARVRMPKDKATVEGTVGIISTFILAAIRNDKFFSLSELNEIIKKRLHDYNHKPFQRKDGSRASMFADERQFLLPLPKNAYEVSDWRVATVNRGYHVLANDNYYSVPFEFIKKKVDIRLTRNTVEILYDNNRIASHIRISGKTGGYSTIEEHMPHAHQQYNQWNGDKYRGRACEAGENTLAVVNSILSSYKVEQQGYRPCQTLLKLGETYSPEELESACERALTYTSSPTLKIVQTLIKSGLTNSAQDPKSSSEPSKYSFTRGADYYGKGGDE